MFRGESSGTREAAGAGKVHPDRAGKEGVPGAWGGAESTLDEQLCADGLAREVGLPRLRHEGTDWGPCPRRRGAGHFCADRSQYLRGIRTEQALSTRVQAGDRVHVGSEYLCAGEAKYRRRTGRAVVLAGQARSTFVPPESGAHVEVRSHPCADLKKFLRKKRLVALCRQRRASTQDRRCAPVRTQPESMPHAGQASRPGSARRTAAERLWQEGPRSRGIPGTSHSRPRQHALFTAGVSGGGRGLSCGERGSVTHAGTCPFKAPVIIINMRVTILPVTPASISRRHLCAWCVPGTEFQLCTGATSGISTNPNVNNVINNWGDLPIMRQAITLIFSLYEFVKITSHSSNVFYLF
ncbi:hypothetical protein NDU88_001679 [Pleurodeles waltl]|uniref:Uncharacterized protein n=1 Tax=Pleurodeles waltl TaxID=8319 RepID=A0AAV7M3U5_PLEWA|nr:hypothetical protein NDU88_001679 [Pleurodeles waltl]